MKAKFLLLLTLALLTLISCVPACSQDTLSQRVISFVDGNMGKKVGTGVCGDLLVKAYGMKLYAWSYENKKARVKTPAPGDMIVFDKVKYEDEDGIHSAPKHGGIVYEVLPWGGIVFAEQNAGVKNLKDSKVILTTIDYNNLITGKITFYRPDYALIEK